MNENDFEINGTQFKLSKIPAMKQFHIVRRLGPMLNDIVPVALKMKASKAAADRTEDDNWRMIGELIQPILGGLSALSDEDANLVLMGLLEAVEVKQVPAGNWARVARDGRLMLETFELPEMLNMAGRAFAFNLSGFFAIAPQALRAAQ